MASVQPVINGGPPMVEVKHIFFKARPPINYFTDEADADAIENDVAFQHFNRSLECSNKFGCLMFSFNNALYLMRIKDVLSAQNTAAVDHSDSLFLKDLRKVEIKNEAFPITPNIISVSNGEDYVAVDTVRGDSAWVVVFNLADFVNQGGVCRPFCEIRCSSNGAARVSAVSWNPGENMNNMMAINTDDGSLFLAKILGPNNVELNRFAAGDVRCLCWSPKGKQLVVGRTNGNLSQLKLDLSEAKSIPGPERDTVPISILWTQTTQFLIVFHKGSVIDFMQLDLAKNAPPTYTNSGDIFISDQVPSKSSCYFLPFIQWNVVLGMTNSASDVVALVKQTQNQNELWTPGDITDNRRAAFLLDHYARGASVYYGDENQVVFSEVESYAPMPMVFLLSQRGSILTYSIVNTDPQSSSLSVKVTASVPDSVFSSQTAPKAAVQPPVQPSVFQPSSTSSVPPQSSLFQATQPVGNPAKPQVQPQLPKPAVVTAPATGFQFSQKPDAQAVAQQTAIKPDPRKLATSTLPTAQDMALLQKAVEEKRREMTTQLQKGTLKGLEDDDQCAFVIGEIRKFEQRLADFIVKQDSNRRNLNGLLNTSFETLEKNVLATLNVVEDFVSDMVSTTNAQKEEVEILKERILNHFSQLEYAKSLVERNRDPRYLEHLRSRPLDPASRQKFQDISKLHNYVKNQIAECRRFFYEQSRKKETTYDRISLTQLIYLTLSNHSQIIRRLNSELDKIKTQLGLGKNVTAFDEAEYLAICENRQGGVKNISEEKSEELDEITLTDLTAGISRVKLNRESDRVDRKPIRLSNRKLSMLRKCMPEVSVVKVKADEAPWSRTPSKPIRPKPMTYPTTTSENSFAKSMESAIKTELESSSNPASLASENVIGTSQPAVSNTRPPSYTGFSTMTSGPAPMNFGSIMKQASTVTGTNLVNPVSTATSLPATKPVQSLLTSNITPPKSSPVTTPVVQKPIGQPINMTSTGITIKNVSSTIASPATQLPTLAGLLATPPASIAPSPKTTPAASSTTTGIFSSTGLSFTTPASVATGGAFSFGTSSPASIKITGSPVTVTTDVLSATANSLFSSPVTTSSVSPASGVTGNKSSPLEFSNLSTQSSNSATSKPQANLLSIGGTTTSADSSAAIKATSVSSGLFSTSVTASSSIASSGLFTSALTSTLSDANSKTTVPSSTTAGGLFSSPVSFTGLAKEGSIFGSAGSVSTIQFGTVSTSKTTDQTTTSAAAATSTPAAPTTQTSSSEPVTVSAVTTPSVSSASTPGGITSNLPATAIVTSSTPTISTKSELFSSSNLSFTSPTTTTSSVFGGGSLTFGTPATGGQLGSATTTSTAVTTTTQSTSLFSSVSTAGGLFSTPTTASTTGGFSSAPATTTTTGLFSTSTASPTPGFFSPTSTTTTSSTPAAGFMSTLSISDSTNKLSNPASTTAGGLFSSPFGNSSSAGSIFGGSGTAFGSQTNSGATGGTATTQSGIFAQAKPTSSIFGSTSTTSPAFGGSATFSSSPFGSSFSTTTAGSTFGSGTASVFGGSTAASQSTGFGTLAQVTASTVFGGTPFGSVQQQSSIFGSPTQQKPATTGGVFSSPAFGSPATSTAGSIFGGGGSMFGGTPVSGAFSTGVATGGVAQQGFGFGQSKPTTGTGFGSPPALAASPVFGGGATFGSASPFGASFTSPTTPAFGSNSSPGVFGGQSASQTAGFGVLAQQGTTTPGFGSSSPGFGSSSTQPSLFGTPPASQQQAKPGFGGQAFSSWR